MTEPTTLYAYTTQNSVNGEATFATGLVTLLEVVPGDDYQSLRTREFLSENSHTRDQLLIELANGYANREVVGVNFDRPPQLPQYERTYDAAGQLLEVRRNPIDDQELEQAIIDALKKES